MFEKELRRFLKLACVGVALAGVLAVVLVFAGDNQSASPVRIVMYGGVPMVFAISALALLFLGHQARMVGAICSIAIVIILFGAELYIQNRNSTDDLMGDLVPELAAGGQWSQGTWNTLATMRNLRAAGERSYPNVCSHLFLEPTLAAQADGGETYRLFDPDGTRILPVTGLSNNLIVRYVPEGETRARTDSYGFNNPPGQWQPDETNIMVIGDSFEYGQDVPFGQGYVDRLRERYSPVVNLGCDGNGPLSMLASLSEYGPLLRPKIVIWGHTESNDLIRDLSVERRDGILMRYLSKGEGQRLANQGELIDKNLIRILESRLVDIEAAGPGTPLGRGFDWNQFSKLGALRGAFGMSYKISSSSLDLFGRALDRAMEIVKDWDGQIIFVYLPAESRFSSPSNRWDANGYRDLVLLEVESRGIEVVDVADVFQAQPHPRALFRLHYTLEGYALIADAIAERLQLMPEM